MPERGDSCVADVEAEPADRSRHPVQQADRVGGAHLHHGRVLRRVVVHQHERLGRPCRGRPPLVGTGPLLDRCVERAAAREHLAQLPGEPRPVGSPVEHRFELELVDGGSRIARPRLCGTHALAVQGEQPDDRREEAGTVGRDHEQSAVVLLLDEHIARGARGEPRALVAARRFAHRRLHAGERGPDARHEIAHELLLPLAPRRLTGRDRVGFSERGEQLEHVAVPDGLRDEANRRGIIEITTGRHLREQEVLTNERHEHVDILGREAHARRELLDDDDARVGVVTRKALADVVQERAHQQEVRSCDRARQERGLRDRLEQVAIDGVAMERVALRFAANRFPLGEDASDKAEVIEGLEHGDHRLTAAEQRDERVARVVRPRRFGWWRQFLDPYERGSLDRRADVRGSCADAQRERRIRFRAGFGTQTDFPTPQHDPAPDRLLPAVDVPLRWARHPRLETAPHLIERPRDGARRLGDVGHEDVGVGHAEPLGHIVLALEQQHVRRPPGRAVQLDPRREQEVVLPRDVDVVGERDRHRVRDRTEQRHVAQTALPLFEIGLEQEGDVAELLVPLRNGARQDRCPPPRVLLRLIAYAGEHAVGQLV